MKYRVIGNNIIAVEISKDYEIISIARWVKESKMYSVSLMLNERTIDRWDLVIEGIKFENSDIKSINKDMFFYIESKYSEGFFNHYIERYQYEQKCFAKGHEIFENEVMTKNGM